ncbi:MAG: hypothetical protein R2784_14145, partial [Saprospiraceae bacterium]
LQNWLDNHGGAEAEDDCNSFTWSHNFTGLSDECGATGSATVTFTVTDACGNSSQTTATFTIEDTTSPSIDLAASNMTVECDGAGNLTQLNTWLAFNGGAVASDVCGGFTWSNNFSGLSDDCGYTGSAIVTFTATDVCGNFNTTTATFTIEDTTNPEIDEEAQDVTFECDGAGNTSDIQAWLDANGNAAASDICSGTTWTHNYTGLSDDCGATGSATVTFTVTDDCGNFSQTTATVTVEDTTNPTIDTEASDMTVQCDGIGNALALQNWLDNNGGAVASDVCSNVTWTNDFTSLSDDCGASGSAIVTFTATDDCGNSSQTTATFTIEDNTAPTIDEEAQDVTFECDGAGNTADIQAWLDANGNASASDICGNVSWSHDYSGLSDDCGETGTAVVTFTATDECGNNSQTTANLTIEDTTPPVITVRPTPLVVECDGAGNLSELQTWLDNYANASASDICSNVTITNNFTGLSDDCGATGSATVIFTATDDCGNSTQTTATFTIEDTTVPDIDEPAQDLVLECDGAGNLTEIQAWLDANGNASASDLCSNVSWTNDFTALSDDCGASGSVLVTFTVTDECGNESQTSATITIEDNNPPMIDVEASNETVECDGAGNLSDLQNWLAANGAFVRLCNLR